MHILIWAGCLLVMAVIQVAINSQGILLGGIPTAVLFFVTWWGARKLCTLWDEDLTKKEAETFKAVPSSVITMCETYSSNLKELKRQLDNCVKSNTITVKQGKLILGYYKRWQKSVKENKVK